MSLVYNNHHGSDSNYEYFGVISSLSTNARWGSGIDFTRKD